jgi:hypothetical protein
VAPTVGDRLTVIVALLVDVHPLAPVPVTVYVCVEAAAKGILFVTPPDQL